PILDPEYPPIDLVSHVRPNAAPAQQSGRRTAAFAACFPRWRRVSRKRILTMASHLAEQDVAWMRQALALAAGVMTLTTPNPRVGCVIVRDGQVLGRGATQRAGGPHAEICALRDAAAAGHDVAGSTFYVTLEPCSHYGRTPPCVNAVLAARPARV